MKRIRFIDISRAIAMIIIVMGHAIVYSKHCSIIFKLLYSFNIPLFFIISGYIFKKSTSYKKFLEKKFVKIMIPYFIWSIIFLIPYLILGNRLNLPSSSESSFNLMVQLKNIFYGNGNNFALKQNSSLWFLPSLFTMEIFFNFVINYIEKIKTRKKYEYFLIFFLLIGIISEKLLHNFYLPWGINTFLNIGIFFYIGYYLKIKKINFNFRVKHICIFIIIGIISCLLNYRNVSAIDYRYGFYILSLISGMSLSMIVIAISKKINKNKVLEYVGNNTMGILIFHKPLLVLFQSKFGILTNILKDSNIIYELLLSIIITFLSIVFSIIVNLVVKKVAPFSLGIIRKEKLND